MDCEIGLFRKVLETNIPYDRIHLISGDDLPIKSQDYIHSFFLNKTDEYLVIKHQKQFEVRIKYYHFFVRRIRKSIWFNFMRRLFLLPQLFFVDRLQSCPLTFADGAEWCSLTLRATKYLCEQITHYRKYFVHSTCCDELYKQMVLESSGLFTFACAEDDCLRYVDFSQHLPSPKVLLIEDYEKIKSSNCLFARKFDINIDFQIIKKRIQELE